jgi:hypothetical protein
MTDVTIPPEVVEAAAKAITMALVLAVEEDCRACALTDDERTELARASIAAALSAWPGALHSPDEVIDGELLPPIISLPFPQKGDA